MHRLVYAVLIGVIGAGIVHIAILFLLPHFSERDAWSRLALAADFYRMVRLDSALGDAAGIRSTDPLFRAVACRFDLEDGVVHVRAPGKVPFWSVSIYDRGGQNIYSFNDRASDTATLDFAVLTPDQMIELRKQLPEELEHTIFVETPLDEGILVVRSFVPDPSWSRIVEAFLSQASCEAI